MTTATAELPVQTDKTAATEPADEWVRDLKSGSKKMDQLPRELLPKVMEKLAAEEDSADPTPELEEKPKEQEVKPETPIEPSVEELKARTERAKAEQKQLADEANQAEQKVEAARKRRDKAKADLEAATKVEVKLPEEMLSEESQSSQIRKTTQLESQVATLTKMLLDRHEDEVKTSEDSHRTISEKSRFLEIEEVQAEFPTLRMTESFEVANNKYANWLTEIQSASGLKELDPNIDPAVLRTRAVEKWNSDPEFQKKIANQPPKENDKLMVLLNAYNTKQAKGGDVMGHLLADLKRRGVLNDMLQRPVQAAATDAANRTAKALTKDSITPVGPGDGSANGYAAPDGTWTVAKARAVIKAVGDAQEKSGHASPEQRKSMREAMNFLATAGT